MLYVFMFLALPPFFLPYFPFLSFSFISFMCVPVSVASTITSQQDQWDIGRISSVYQKIHLEHLMKFPA